MPEVDPVDHDPFSAAVSANDPTLRITVRPQTAEPPASEPVANPNPFGWRNEYSQELSNPAVRDRLLAMTHAEVGAQGPQAQQAFIETIFNRANARHQSLAETLAGGYFPGITHQRAAGGVNDDQRALYGPLVDQVMGGSNFANYGTGNASGGVTFNRGPRTAGYGGENFGIEGPDSYWAREQGYTGQLVPVDYDPWARAAERVRSRYPTREPDPASLAASQGKGANWGALGSGLAEGFATPGRAYKEGLTPEEEINWAGGTALGMLGARSPFIGEGEAGIFGGRLAKTANTQMLARAEEMAAQGMPREAIWNQTGWFQGADKKWRFEIPDQEATTKIGFGAEGEQPLEHKPLMEAYPQLKDYTLDINKGDEGGFMMPPKVTPGYISAHGPDATTRTSVTLHELQHGVQEIEGFTPGSSTTAAAGNAFATKIAKKMVSVVGRDWDALNPFERKEWIKAARHELYKMVGGEVEARNVQTRQDFEHRQVPPWATQDVPFEQQITRNSRGKVVPVQKYEPVEHNPFAVPVNHDPFAFEEHPGLISTRFPTAVKAAEDPLKSRLGIDTAAMRADPDAFKHNVYLTRRYPNLTRVEAKGTPEQVAQALHEHMADNLLWLYDRVPTKIREDSKLWYDGARKIIDERAKQYNLTTVGNYPAESSVAGVYAAMSPQKDWFQNVSLGDRVLSIVHNQRNTMFTPEMGKNIPEALQKYRGLIKSIKGKSYGELTDGLEKSMWLRLYDEAHNPREYRLVRPDGSFGDFVRKQNGEPAKVAWGSLGEIAKAIGSYEARGNVDKISALMGERHKVRSFYNNMLYPRAPYGDVTIDTHAVAAALLRPLSGNSREVSQNFGNYFKADVPRAKGSAVTGTQGLYGLYADAYREAARQRGILPREMQSITWEAARGLFTDTFKSQPRHIAAVERMWKKYRDGKATLDQTREQVHEYAGGIRAPAWAEPRPNY